MNLLLSSIASIPSPSNGVLHIGPLPVHAYGLMLAIGVLVAIRIAERRYERAGHDPTAIAEMGVTVVAAGVIGARVYHLFTGYDWESGGVLGALKIWEGGLSIWGAVGGGAIAVLIVARRRHIDAVPLMDAMGPAVVVAQAIGRWGNWFNQELFGGPTNLPWALEIDPAHRPDHYLDSATFHPTFLYESLWCILVFATITLAERRFRFRRGQAVTLYIAMYTFGRFFFENMRVDPASRIFGMRFNGLLSAALCVGATTWFVVLARRPVPDIADVPEPETAAAHARATAKTVGTDGTDAGTGTAAESNSSSDAGTGGAPTES